MTLKLDSDESLMIQVAKGKNEHLEPLVRRHANPLLTFICRLIGDQHRSEEVFQEVFLAVWKNRKAYQYPRPFKSWLYAIALNKCRQWQRGRRLFAVEPELHADSAHAPVTREPSAEQQAIATETAGLVAEAIALLPVQQRAVVALRVWNGLSYAEIANIVERTESTVRSNMHHGLAAMRKYLEPRLL